MQEFQHAGHRHKTTLLLYDAATYDEKSSQCTIDRRARNQTLNLLISCAGYSPIFDHNTPTATRKTNNSNQDAGRLHRSLSVPYMNCNIVPCISRDRHPYQKNGGKLRTDGLFAAPVIRSFLGQRLAALKRKPCQGQTRWTSWTGRVPTAGHSETLALLPDGVGCA